MVGVDIAGDNYHRCVAEIDCQAAGFVDSAAHKCVAEGACQTRNMYTNLTEVATERVCVDAAACQKVGFLDETAKKCVSAAGCGDKIANDAKGKENRKCIEKTTCAGYYLESENTCVTAENCGELVGDETGETT